MLRYGFVHTAFEPQKISEYSFFRQPRLAQALKRWPQHWLALNQPFDRELGIDSSSFDEGGFCLIHFTFERTCGSQIQVRLKDVITAIDRPAGFVDRHIKISEAELGIGHEIVPLAH